MDDMPAMPVRGPACCGHTGSLLPSTPAPQAVQFQMIERLYVRRTLAVRCSCAPCSHVPPYPFAAASTAQTTREMALLDAVAGASQAHRQTVLQTAIK